MRWKNRKGSKHVEDRRGEAIPSGGSSRGLGIAGGLGIGKILFSLFRRGSGKTKMMMIAGVFIAMFVFKFNPLSLLGAGGNGNSMFGSNSGTTQQRGTPPPPDDEYGDFLSVVTGINQRFWEDHFPKTTGLRFKPAKVVIYSVGTTMADGSIADARMGPFYMPTEQTIYIDPTFFETMRDEFGVKGEFARAYVMSHEYGHHIQNLLGLTTKLHKMHGRASKVEYNRGSVRLELHADFLAGVCAHHDDKNFDSLDRADIISAMSCAKAIGDDILQKRAGQRVNSDHFTHGTAEQRARWFMRGYQNGNVKEGELIYTMDYDSL